MSNLQDQDLADLESGSPTAVVDEVDLETARRVEGFVVALLKDYRTRQAYARGNQLIDRFHGAVLDQLHELWDLLPHLTLTIDEGRLLWRDFPVYDEPIGHDNFAFMFFRDGLRTLALLPGCDQGELREFLEILANFRRGQAADLLATLWHRDFSFVRIEYVDVGEDEGVQVPAGDRNSGAGDTIADLTEIERVVSEGPVSAEVDDGFNKILLSEAEHAYLQREIELELERPLPHDVTLALLDQFEMRDQERRRQVVDILRGLLPRLLAEPDFATVALIVNELQLLANRTGEQDTQQLVLSLLRDMSEAMADLVSARHENYDEGPQQHELEALLGALQAEAIPTLVRALPAMTDFALREQVEDALDDLVARFPDQLATLTSADDPMLAAEAAKIIARLGLVDALGDLVRMTKRVESIARRAGVEALGHMPVERAGATVLRALDDDDWTVRKAALEAITRLTPPGATRELRRHIASRSFAGRDEVEQAVFLRTLVVAGPEEAVPELSRLLNGRGRWGVKHAPIVRAGAARALALVGTPAAVAVLTKAMKDRNSTVADAVRLSLRHLEQNVGTLEDGVEG
jgi:HEAT repeat protein